MGKEGRIFTVKIAQVKLLKLSGCVLLNSIANSITEGSCDYLLISELDIFCTEINTQTRLPKVLTENKDSYETV
jgi:hypothetical protein